jgi:very-short-patch-repair endonuclease
VQRKSKILPLNPLKGTCECNARTDSLDRDALKAPLGVLGEILKTMQRTPQIPMFYGAKVDVFEKARLLRENMTIAEKLLWERLNKNQLGVRFKPQHPVDIFIVDFYCHKYKLVVEVDGKYHENNIDYDMGRTAELERFDLKVIRFTNEQVINDIENVIDEIKQNLCERAT